MLAPNQYLIASLSDGRWRRSERSLFSGRSLWARITKRPIDTVPMRQANSQRCLRSLSVKFVAPSVSTTKCSPTISGSNGGILSTAGAPVIAPKIFGWPSRSHCGNSEPETASNSAIGSPPVMVARASARSSLGVAPAGRQKFCRSRSITSAIRRSASKLRTFRPTASASARKYAKSGRLSRSILASCASVVSRSGNATPAASITCFISGQGSDRLSSGRSGWRASLTGITVAPWPTTLSSHSPRPSRSIRRTRTGWPRGCVASGPTRPASPANKFSTRSGALAA